MSSPHYHDTPDIVIAATQWLMHRYRQTRCSRLAHLIEQHLRWLESGAGSPRLAEAWRRLTSEWRALSPGKAGMNAARNAGAPIPLPTVH